MWFDAEGAKGLYDSIANQLNQVFPSSDMICRLMAGLLGYESLATLPDRQHLSRKQTELLKQLVTYLKDDIAIKRRVVRAVLAAYILQNYTAGDYTVGKWILSYLQNGVESKIRFLMCAEESQADISDIEVFAFKEAVLALNIKEMTIEWGLNEIPEKVLNKIAHALKTVVKWELNVPIILFCHNPTLKDRKDLDFLNRFMRLIRCHSLILSAVYGRWHQGLQSEQFNQHMTEFTATCRAVSVSTVTFSGFDLTLFPFHVVSALLLESVKRLRLIDCNLEQAQFLSELHQTLTSTRVNHLSLVSRSLINVAHSSIMQNICNILALPQLVTVEVSGIPFLDDVLYGEECARKVLTALQRPSLEVLKLGCIAMRTLDGNICKLFIEFIKTSRLSAFEFGGNYVSHHQMRNFLQALDSQYIKKIILPRFGFDHPVSALQYYGSWTDIEWQDVFYDIFKHNSSLIELEQSFAYKCWEKNPPLSNAILMLLQENNQFNVINKYLAQIAITNDAEVKLKLIKKTHKLFFKANGCLQKQSNRPIYNTMRSKFDAVLHAAWLFFKENNQFKYACQCAFLISEQYPTFIELRCELFQLAYTSSYKDKKQNHAEAFLEAFPACINASLELIVFKDPHDQKVFDEFLARAVNGVKPYTAASQVETISMSQRETLIQALLLKQQKKLLRSENPFRLFKSTALNLLIQVVRRMNDEKQIDAGKILSASLS